MKLKFLVLFLGLFLSGCGKDLVGGGKTTTMSNGNRAIAACNSFKIGAAPSGFYINRARVRHPNVAEAGMTTQDQLLLKILTVDINSSWFNPNVPIRTRFYRQNASGADSTPLSMSYYYRPTGAKLNQNVDYFSNEILWGFKTQLGMSTPPPLEDLDVLVNGTGATWPLLSVRFDQSQSGETGVAYFLNLVPDFFVDFSTYSTEHPGNANPLSFVGKLLSYHPKNPNGSNYDSSTDLATTCNF